MTPPILSQFKREKPPHTDIQLGLTIGYTHQPRGLTPVPPLRCPQLEKRCPLSMAIARCLADR